MYDYIILYSVANVKIPEFQISDKKIKKICFIKFKMSLRLPKSESVFYRIVNYVFRGVFCEFYVLLF